MEHTFKKENIMLFLILCISLSTPGDIAGKRCLLIDDSKESDNLHLCFDKSAPYDLSWSDVDQTDVDGKSRCLKMENPHDWAWGKQKFLCQ